MKYSFINFICLIIFSLFIYSCSKDDFNNPNDVVIENLNFNYNSLSDQDKIKVVVAEAISSFLTNNPSFNDKLFSELITSDNKTQEFLYIKEKDNEFINGKTLENLLLEFYNDDENKAQLISNINNILPNLVLKIPEWSEILLSNENLNLQFAVYPCIVSFKTNRVYFRNGQMSSEKTNKTISNVLSEYLPIQVEESERLIPVEKNSNTTIWGDDFYESNFPFLPSCSEFDRQNYTSYSNENYDFIDKITLNVDLVNARLCAIQIPDSNNNLVCDIVYERDCRTEKNVIEGIKIANLATYLAINNQPGGEDAITLHYDFTVASMCGDLMETEICPPSDWSLVFNCLFSDFFELKLRYGIPTQSELSSIIFSSGNYYVTATPIYYDIPVEFSAEEIYSQARHLPLVENGTWDGNKYGDAISFSIHEHDDITVNQTETYSISVSNTTKVSNKLSMGEIFEVGGDFSNSITRSSTTTITLNAAEDVELGKTATNYYEQNFTNSAIQYGYNITTGSVNTHFAFYY